MFTLFVVSLTLALLLVLYLGYDFIRHHRNQKRLIHVQLTNPANERRCFTEQELLGMSFGFLEERMCLKHRGHELRKCVSCDGTGDGNLKHDVEGPGPDEDRSNLLPFKVCTHCAGHGQRWVDPKNVSDLT